VAERVTLAAMRLLRDSSASTVTAGLIAVLVGFTSSVAIVFQAATALGATPEQVGSWMWALGIGMGLCSLVPSLILRQPVMIAWSTPGAAVLATAGAAGSYGMAEATGAFLVSAALVVIVGATGLFERFMDRIPKALANALLAGVLARFALDAFLTLGLAFGLVAPMIAAYLAGRRWWPRQTVPVVLLVGVVIAAAQGELHVGGLPSGLTMPVFTAPVFTLRAAVSLALPLFVVTMASQNLPGVAVMRGAGYTMPVSRLVTMTGIATAVLAPFGAYALNFAAITAAICMGREAHEDPARRYTAAVWSGAVYIVIGLFGAAVAGVLAGFPKALVAAVAGLALLGSIGGGLAAALRDERDREPALITFLVTLSGVSLVGIGSAFWGVVLGALAMLARRRAA
jgi:benzoate membrane transport protein